MKKILICFCLIILYRYSYGQQDSLPHVLLKRINGTKIYASQLSDTSHFTVISFWATWCKFCVAELTAISKNYRHWKDSSGISFLAISVDEGITEDYIKSYIERRKWPFPILWDYKQSLKKSLAVQEIPYLIVINNNGKIVWKKTGFNPGDELLIYQKIQELSEK